MRLQKFGHACLLVESGDARLLLDPGGFSRGYESLDGLTAVLVTHQHPDHVDVERLEPLLTRNPDAQLVTDVGTAQLLRDEHGIEATVATAGDTLHVGVDVRVLGELHAEIHRDVERIPNVGYLVGREFFHPGDALTVPDEPVRVLGLPAAAPWMRVAEAVDYLRAVRPAVAVPIHEAVSAVPAMYYGMLDRLRPEQTEFRDIDDGQPVEL